MALRDNPLGELKVPLAWTAGVALIVAIGLALIARAAGRRAAVGPRDSVWSRVPGEAPVDAWLRNRSGNRYGIFNGLLDGEQPARRYRPNRQGACLA